MKTAQEVKLLPLKKNPPHIFSLAKIIKNASIKNG
jgi:hypothetical protein